MEYFFEKQRKILYLPPKITLPNLAIGRKAKTTYENSRRPNARPQMPQLLPSITEIQITNTKSKD